MISAVDSVTMLPRTVGAAETQAREQSQVNTLGEQASNQMQAKVEQESQQTVETQQTETEEYDGGGNGGGQAGNNKKKKKDEKQEAKMAPRSNSSFDIMI